MKRNYDGTKLQYWYESETSRQKGVFVEVISARWGTRGSAPFAQLPAGTAAGERKEPAKWKATTSPSIGIRPSIEPPSRWKLIFHRIYLRYVRHSCAQWVHVQCRLRRREFSSRIFNLLPSLWRRLLITKPASESKKEERKKLENISCSSFPAFSSSLFSLVRLNEFNSGMCRSDENLYSKNTFVPFNE